MKRILLSLSVLAMAYTVNSQTFISEDFNAMTVGDLGNQGSWLVYPDPLPEAQIVSVGTGDNALQLSGSSSATGTKYVYKAVDWASRTVGNDVLFTEFILHTGPATTSLNSFTAGFFDDAYNITIGLKYTPSTNVVEGLIYDTDGTYLVKLDATDVTLSDDMTYFVSMWYDSAKGQAYWYIADDQSATVCVQGTSFTNSSTSPITEFDFMSRTTTGNTASTYAFFDALTIKARPCLYYDTKDNATFAYSTGTVCNTASNLTPTLVDGGVTGMYSSTPAGLSISSSTGLITTSSSSAGTYTVQFASNVANTCDDSTTVSITIQDCVGLPEHLSSAFSVAPNPAKFNVTVTLSENAELNSVIRLMTSEGKEVETRVVSNNKEEVFDVSNLEAGIYFIQLGNKIEKVIVQ